MPVGDQLVPFLILCGMLDEGIGLAEQPRPSNVCGGKTSPIGKDHACELIKTHRIYDDVFEIISTEIYKRYLVFRKTLVFYRVWVMWIVLPEQSMWIAKHSCLYREYWTI